MALQLKGEHAVPLAREQVWCLLNDPEVLQHAIPGCEKLVRVDDDKYELGLALLVGSVSGNYTGSVVLSDKQPLEYYDLALAGEGSIGFVKGKARFALTEKAGGTIISYDGEAEVGGLVAGVGNRVLSGVAKFMVQRFFKEFDRYVKEHDLGRFTLMNHPHSSSAPAPATVEAQVDVGGASLRVLMDDRQNGRQDAPWLVMSHSILADSHIFDEQAAALRDRFRILRIDCRGHGGSTASPPPYDMALLVEDVVKVLDHFNIERTHFLGLSLGGMTGFGLALTHPHRLASLVLASARADAPDGFISAWDDRVAAVREGGMRTLATPTVERWLSADFLAAHPDVRSRIVTVIERVQVQGFEGCARALQGLNYLPDLHRIQTPTLLVAGANDATIPDDMKAIRSRMPNAQLEVIAGSGHIPTLDNPVEFNRIVVPFLERAAGI